MKNTYRPEIDGLRAFAVIAVIINHCNEDFLSGGYLGVDIFFVISGYVITSSLQNRPATGFKDFIIGFYERRIKRILPALCFFIITMSIITCLFYPSPKDELTTALFSLIGFSNVQLFLNSTNYFAASTDLNPFVHTWSLGVEEQFYIIFPLLVWFSGFSRHTARGAKNLLFTIGLLAIASLLSFAYLYTFNQSAAYFLMPMRFWEMATGCLLLIGMQKQKSTKRIINKIPSFIFLIAIICTMLMPISQGVAATCGIVFFTSCLIVSLENGGGIYKLLSNKNIIYIGLISYSLYLWHWGILAIMRMTIGVSIATLPLFITATFGLAIVSYEYIEKRSRRMQWSPKSLFTIYIGLAYLSGTAIFLQMLSNFLGKYIYLGSKSESQPLEQIQTAAKNYIGEYSKRDSQNCRNIIQENITARSIILKCSTANGKASAINPTLIFIGDSHSGMMMPLSEMLYHKDNIETVDIFNDGCTIPELGNASKRCLYMDNTLRNLSLLGKEKFVFIINSNIIGSDEYVQDTIKLSQEVTKYGSKIVIMLPNPRYPALANRSISDHNICKQEWFRPAFAMSNTCGRDLKINRKEWRNKLRGYESKLLNYSELNSNFFVYNPDEELCATNTPLDNYCSPLMGKEFLYYDDNHISIKGAKLLYPRFNSFLKSNRLLH